MPSIIAMGSDATRSVGRTLAGLLSGGDVVILTGELGAGKTVFAKGVAEGLEVEGDVTSPTFNILLVYPGRVELNHFDLYRLEHADQLEDIAYWEILEGGGVSLVEWGDRFAEAMPPEHLVVSITIEDDERRRIEFTGRGVRGIDLAQGVAEAATALDRVETA